MYTEDELLLALLDQMPLVKSMSLESLTAANKQPLQRPRQPQPQPANEVVVGERNIA